MPEKDRLMKMHDFDDIRPYFDEEIPAAMARITESVHFPLLASYVFPGENLEKIRQQLLSFRTIKEFQESVMYQANAKIIENSISEFTYSGIEHLQPGKKYLFISNHRDIMLDASMLQQILFDIGEDTCEITFGENLMSNQLVIDIGKSNKMFKVVREASPREFYRCSELLSEYIRYVITEKKQSVWIAQRNGRTKDGNDQTDQGIISMLSMSLPTDKIRAISELNIVPISLSYEWEPCDILKVLELVESKDKKYTKKPGEDLNSILTGILQDKGRVHFHFGKPITSETLQDAQDLRGARYAKYISEIIDRSVHENYRIFPNNYIAYDLKFGGNQFEGKYTEEELEKFKEHLEELLKFKNYSMQELSEIMLDIYSIPLENKLKYQR